MTSLSVDLAGSAVPGDGIEARVDLHRVGNRVFFARCFIWHRRERIARASGTFLVLRAAE